LADIGADGSLEGDEFRNLVVFFTRYRGSFTG
jgi:hypothetical protein